MNGWMKTRAVCHKCASACSVHIPGLSQRDHLECTIGIFSGNVHARIPDGWDVSTSFRAHILLAVTTLPLRSGFLCRSW